MNLININFIGIKKVLIFIAFFFITLESFYSYNYSINFFYISSLVIFFFIFVSEFFTKKFKYFQEYNFILFYFIFIFFISINASFFYNFEILKPFYFKFLFVILLSFSFFYFLRFFDIKKILLYIVFFHIFFFYLQFLIFYTFNIQLNLLEFFWGIKSTGFHQGSNYSANIFEKIQTFIYLFKEKNFLFDLTEEGRENFLMLRRNTTLPRFTGLYDEVGTFICMMIILSSLIIFKTRKFNAQIFLLLIFMVITTVLAASLRGYIMLIPFLLLFFIRFNLKEYKILFLKYKILLSLLILSLVVYGIIYIYPRFYGILNLIPGQNKLILYLWAVDDYFTLALDNFYYLFFGTGISNQIFSFEFTSLTKDTSLLLILLSRFGILSFLLLIFIIYKNNQKRLLECSFLFLIILLGKFYFYNPVIILTLTILMMKNDRETEN